METLTLKYTEDSVDYEQEFELLSLSGFTDIDKVEFVGIQHRHLDGSVTENITGFRRVYGLDFGVIQDYAQQKFISDFLRNTDREMLAELNYAPVVFDAQRFVNEWKDNLKIGRSFFLELIDSRVFGAIVSTLNTTLLFDPDNTYDIGAAGATRPRDLHLGRNALIGGTLGVTGNFAINTNKFTVTASSGNTVVAGTLGVTGATTLTGLLTVNNDITLGNADAGVREIARSNANGNLTIRGDAVGSTAGGWMALYGGSHATQAGNILSQANSHVFRSLTGGSTFATIATGLMTLTGAIKTSAPTGGSGNWELGIANSVSPTSPNRTITVEIGGTAYYIHAKTTND